MTENVTSFSHTDSLYDVCNCLIDHEFRRVPILNKGRLVGIITRADIVMFTLKTALPYQEVWLAADGMTHEALQAPRLMGHDLSAVGLFLFLY